MGINYKQYLTTTSELLTQSQLERESYKTTVAGQEFLVYPEVFSPKYFNDTELFAQHFPAVTGKTILEIGPGTGAIAITLAYRGAKKVVSIDINPAAVHNTRDNITLHNMNDRVEVRQGDVYGPLLSNECFDVIFWNVPFGLVPANTPLEPLQRAVFDPGYKAIEQFITQAPKYLMPKGRLIIGFSSTLGKLELIQLFANQAGFTLKLLGRWDSTEIEPAQFELWEASRRHHVGASQDY